MASKSGELQPLLTSRTSESDDDGRAVRRRASWVLPMVVICYFLSYMTPVIILGPYLYDKVAREYDTEFNSSSQHPCANKTSNETMQKIQDEIQRRVSSTELYLGLVKYLFAAVPILILGPLTDKYGRRIGLLFPIVGTLLKQVVYAVVIAKDYPIPYLVIAHIFGAAGGSFAAMLSMMFSVTADITQEGRQRSFRIAVMEALYTLTASAGQFAVAQWIKTSYFYPLLGGLALGGLAFLATIFLMPETVEIQRLVAPRSRVYVSWRALACSNICGFLGASWKMLKRSFLLYIKDGTGSGRLVKRRLVILAFILTVAVNISKPGVQMLYLMKYPLCWPVTRTLVFGSIQMVCNWVAILALLAIMQRMFKMADRHVAVVGMVSSLTSAVFMSLAINDVMVYEVAVLSVMIRAVIPMLRSIMSSLVNSSDQGALYASLGCIETVGAAVFGITANRVYFATLSLWAGAVFLMFAGFMAVALLLLIILNVLYARDRECQRRREQALQEGSVGNIQEEPDPSW